MPIPTYSIFVYMLPLAALPIFFHLFFKLQKRVRPFPSLMFFYRIDPQFKSRKKIREFLVLLLRMLIIFLTLAALSKPVIRGWGSSGDKAVVYVIDNSASMAAISDGGKTVLAHALDGASALLTELESDESGGIVATVPEPTLALPSTLVPDKALLQSQLDTIQPTHAAGSPGRALSRALAMLQESGAINGEIHVFTDLQSGEWNRQSQGIKSPGPGITIVVHRIKAKAYKTGNVAVTDVRLPRHRLVAGRGFTTEVSLKNTGSEPVEVRLNTVDDLDRKWTRKIEVAAGVTRSVGLRMASAPEGSHWLELWVEGDDFKPDNRLGFAYRSEPVAEALFVGRFSQYGQLHLALSPTGDGRSGIRTSSTSPILLADRLKSSTLALLVMTWESLSEVQRSDAALVAAIDNYVEEGGNLLIVANRTARDPPSELPDWVICRPLPRVSSNTGVDLAIFDRGARIWDELRSPEGDVLLKRIRADLFFPLELPDTVNSLLSLEDGRAVLAVAEHGEGQVYYSGVAFDTRWTNLPYKSAFLAMAHSMVLNQVSDSQRIRLTEAGGPVAGVIPDGELQVLSVAGGPLDWKDSADQFEVFSRTGVYRIKSGDKSEYVSVKPAADEGIQTFVEGDKVELLGALDHRVLDYKDQQSLVAAVSRLRTGVDLFLPLILLAVIALALEGILVNLPDVMKSKKKKALAKPAI